MLPIGYVALVKLKVFKTQKILNQTHYLLFPVPPWLTPLPLLLITLNSRILMESCKLEPQRLLVVHGGRVWGERVMEAGRMTDYTIWMRVSLLGLHSHRKRPEMLLHPPTTSVTSLPTKDSQSLLQLRMPIRNSHFFICFINFLDLLKISFSKILILNYIFLQCFGILYHFGNAFLQLFLLSYHQSVFILFIY